MESLERALQSAARRVRYLLEGGNSRLADLQCIIDALPISIAFGVYSQMVETGVARASTTSAAT